MATKPSPAPAGTEPSPGGGNTLPAGSLPAPAPVPAKRGRPTNESKGLPLAPKHGPAKSQGASRPVAAKTSAPTDPTFIVETAATFLDIADEGLAALVAKRVGAFLPADKQAEFLQLRRQAAWGDRELELFKKAVAEIVAKHDWAARYGPEILLGLLLTQYGVRQARVFAALSRMEAQFVQARRNGGDAKPADKPEEKPVVPPVAKPEEQFPGPVGT